MKRVYLTIDDGPSSEFRKKIDFLHKRKIPAVFFCKGCNIEKRMDDVVYAIKKGFTIGNHSYNHPHFSIISLDEAKQEIKKTDDLIELAYKKAKIRRKVKLFRFPYGDRGFFVFFISKPSLQRYLSELGYVPFGNVTHLRKGIDVYWTLDTWDWKNEEAGVVAERIKKNIRKYSSRKEVVIMHDHEKKKFFEIIEIFLKEGYKFISFYGRE